MPLKYLAYGSNMHVVRLQQRVPSVRCLGAAFLAGHRVDWDKPSKDGSGKCHIVEADEASTWGVLWQIDTAEKPALDKVEGVGKGYEEKEVELLLRDESIRVITYYATRVQRGLLPYLWYKAYVIEGAKQNGLPTDYIRTLDSIESVEDPVEGRRNMNESILRSGRSQAATH